MGAQPREVKVLTALSASMTIGFIVLMALGDNPPSAGAFCLASYYLLEPSESVISSVPSGSLRSWKSIEVSHVRVRTTSESNSGDSPENDSGTDSLSAMQGSHFLVCHGIIGSDGQIIATRMWKEQLETGSPHDQGTQEQKIRVCVMMSSNMNRATDLQAKRVDALVTALSREFGIRPDCISYDD